MTLQTNTAAAATGTAKPLLANTNSFRALVTMIVVATMMLTGWTAAQANVVNDALDANGPAHPSIRQLARQAEVVKWPDHLKTERAPAQEDVQRPQHPSVRQSERAAQLRAEWLATMENSELRRFRNRAPVEDRVVLDEAIAHLEAALA